MRPPDCAEGLAGGGIASAGADRSARAAAKWDEAAGLRERLSSGRYCVGVDDPFAQAVVADAERISGSLSVRSHIRLRSPRPLGFAIIALVLACMSFLV